MKNNIKFSFLSIILTFLFVGCGSYNDYREYLNHMPKSILILPPTNSSVEPKASYQFLSTITRPVAEAGYYVFPVAVVEQMMKDNGLPTAQEMHNVSLKKIEEIFDADAVLYINISQWGKAYRIIESATEVSFQYHLVDVKSGKTLWQHEAHARYSSNGNNTDLASLLISAIATHIIESAADIDHSRNLAIEANHNSINHKKRGLLKGQRHPRHSEDQEFHINRQREQ